MKHGFDLQNFEFSEKIQTQIIKYKTEQSDKWYINI